MEPLTTSAGFVALYRRDSELVLRFCARRVLDADAAVDLCAETFAQAFRGAAASAAARSSRRARGC